MSCIRHDEFRFGLDRYINQRQEQSGDLQPVVGFAFCRCIGAASGKILNCARDCNVMETFYV